MIKTDQHVSIAIVDDERPARAGLRLEIEDLITDAEIYEADSGAAAIQLLSEQPVDLLFLDINLGDMKSTALVPALHKLQPKMMICFVTAYSEYALEAFRLEVDDYIMKPFEPERIERVIRRRIEGLQEEGSEEKESDNSSQRFPISCKDRTIYVDINDLVYIETFERGCMVYTVANSYFDTHNIGAMEKRLPDFYRIHKSYIVNPSKIREVFPWGKNTYCLKMEGYPENILPIGREKFKQLRGLLER